MEPLFSSDPKSAPMPRPRSHLTLRLATEPTSSFNAQVRIWPLCMIIAVCCSAQAAHAAPLRVHGKAQFSGLQVQRESNSTRITGALRDEANMAVTGQPVTLSSGLVVADDCSGGKVTTTSDSGAFCFELKGRAQGLARLSFQGNAFLHAATRDVPLDAQPKVELRASTPSGTWSLVEPTHPLHIELHSGTGDRYRLQLRVVRAAGEELPVDLQLTLGPDPSLEVEVPSAALGGPGTVQLMLLLGDDARRPLATQVLPLLLTAPVELQWAMEPSAVRPELGFDVQVRATALGLPIDSGWVETRARAKVLNSAPVAAGLATVSNRFLAAGQGSVPFAARYVSQHPWFLAGPPLQVELLVKRPSAWVHLPWLLIGLVAAVWIFRAWWRPVRRNFAPPAALHQPAPVPGISAHEPTPHDGSYRGLVLDVHTAEPIAGAWLRVLLPSVGVETAVAETRSDTRGQFGLAPLGVLPEGARFEITAPNHSRLRLVPPVPGRLEIRLMSRRRSLLQRLSEWAQERRWADARPMTPGDVAARARRNADAEVERWALDLQEAAFGSSPVDEQHERALKGRAPALTVPTPVKR
jgi:hypothetical protein